MTGVSRVRWGGRITRSRSILLMEATRQITVLLSRLNHPSVDFFFHILVASGSRDRFSPPHWHRDENEGLLPSSISWFNYCNCLIPTSLTQLYAVACNEDGVLIAASTNNGRQSVQFARPNRSSCHCHLIFKNIYIFFYYFGLSPCFCGTCLQYRHKERRRQSNGFSPLYHLRPLPAIIHHFLFPPVRLRLRLVLCICVRIREMSIPLHRK